MPVRAGGSESGFGGRAALAGPDVPAPGPGQQKVVLEDLGMACPLCRAAVSAKLSRTPGIIAYSVDVASDSATVLYDPSTVGIDRLKDAIAEAGYNVRGIREVQE